MSATPDPDPVAIREQIDRLGAAPGFRGANRALELLRYLVGEMLAGRATHIKEYTIGSTVLGRGEAFDPREDSIVRVEASRLRQRLEHHYAKEGAADAILIRLPRGSYVPEIIARQMVTSDLPTARAASMKSIATGALLVIAGLAAGWWWRNSSISTEPVPRPVHLDLDLGLDVMPGNEIGSDFALSRDGSLVVFVASRPDGSIRLFARPMDGTPLRELPGTGGARAPFLSPDGAWVGFWSQGTIKKTLVSGAGSPVVVAPATDLFGASWNADGDLVATIGPTPVLWKLSHSGTALEPLLDLSSAQRHPRWPQWLPEGRGILYTSMFGSTNRSIEIFVPADGTRRTLVESGSYGRYLPDGRLAYVDRGTLFTVPFDLARLEVTGPPVALVQSVAESFFGSAQFDVSDSGTLVYRADNPLTTIAWLDRKGNRTPVLDAPGRYRFPRLSPDGSRLALAIMEDSDFDIWILDLASGGRSRLSRGPGDEGSPVWTPSGDALVYNSNGGPMVWARVDGTAPEVVLHQPVSVPTSFAPDGSRLAFALLDRATNFDVWSAPLRMESGSPTLGTASPVHVGPGMQGQPAISPDGRWVAYGSNESGVLEVYVRPFEREGRAVRVSANGGGLVRWSRIAPQLLYGTDDHHLRVLRYRIEGGEFVPGAPEEWGPVVLADTGLLPNYDLAPDGRVIALLPAASAGSGSNARLRIVLNAFAVPRAQ